MGEKYTKEELIDLYLRDMLDPDAKAAFEEEMHGDDSLAREVELSRQIVNAIERKGEQGAAQELAAISEDELKRILSLAETKPRPKAERQRMQSLSEGKHRPSAAARTPLWKWGGVAAAAAIIAVIIIGIQPRYSSQDLYATSYERPVYDPAISRGDAEIPYDLKVMLDDAGQLYESGDMPGAAEIYNKVVDEFPQDVLPDDALFYYAVTLCETNRITEAQNIFSKLAAEPDSEYTEDAQWQSALSYLRLGDRKEAINILESVKSAGGVYAPQADELLDRLKQKRLFRNWQS